MNLKLTAVATAASLLQIACGGGGAAVTDTTPPTVTITDNITAQDATASVTFSFDFSEDVGTSLAAEDILVNGGVAGALTRLGATSYTLVVTPTANTTGTLNVSIPAAKFADTAGNANAVPATASQSFNTVVVPVDTTPPTVTITDNVPAQDATTSVTFSLNFSEDVGSSFTADDILVSGGVAGALTRLGAASYTLVVIPTANTTGTLSVSIPAAKFTDMAGNANAVSATASQSFNTVGQLPGWTLAWSDEFSVDGLPDPGKWVYDTERNRAGWFNNEKQYYASARLENSSVQNGMLTITARKESLSTAADYGNQAYTSARLITRGKASWTYGYYEVRAKLPCSLGTWPAIWMLGTGGRWPEDGEIDIMEQRGTSAAAKGEVLGTIHTKGYNYFGGTFGVAQGASTTVADACTNFHNYQLTWSADKIVMAVDGVPYFEFLNPKDGDYEKWPFDRPQFMILNLAMGGDLGGAIPGTFTSDQMVVDYVRVYRK
jgi:beta-glucanase (GH16 family)